MQNWFQAQNRKQAIWYGIQKKRRVFKYNLQKRQTAAVNISVLMPPSAVGMLIIIRVFHVIQSKRIFFIIVKCTFAHQQALIFLILIEIFVAISASASSNWIQQIDTCKDNDETANQWYHIDWIICVEALKQNGWSCDRCCSETNKVDGIHTVCIVSVFRYTISNKTHLHIGGELFQSLVEIVHLRDNAYDDDNEKSICWRMCELIISSKCQFQSNSKSLDSHDRNWSNQWTNRDVNEWVSFAILWCHLVNHEQTNGHHNSAIAHKAYNAWLITNPFFSWLSKKRLTWP